MIMKPLFEAAKTPMIISLSFLLSGCDSGFRMKTDNPEAGFARAADQNSEITAADESEHKPMRITRMMTSIANASLLAKRSAEKKSAADSSSGAIDQGKEGSSANSCQKPRYYSYTLTSDLNITCDTSFEGRTRIFNVKVADEGFSISRANLKLRNNMNQAGGWSVSAYYYGGHGTSFDMADNINPGDTKFKTVLGSGKLGAGSANNQILVSGYQYGANSCSDGGFSVLAGSTLEVWVEDPKSECQGKYLALKSHYQSGGAQVAWGNDFLSIDIPRTSDSSKILLVSSIEGTLDKCMDGSLSTIVSTPFHSLIGSPVSDSVPTAGASPNGFCHLSLATSNLVSYSPSVTSATLHPRNHTNTNVYSGLGGKGEALIGFIKY